MRKLRVFALALVCLTAAADRAAAATDPWEARLPDGRTLHIVQDYGRGDEAFVLVRRQLDGREDSQFGPANGTPFKLGPDNAGPETLRADGLGRAWIAGAASSEGRTQAVVLRYQPNGMPDAAYGRSGRSAVSPVGHQARATELLPMPDGSAWVAGTVIDGPAGEHAGWWRLGPDGNVDVRFAAAGLWEGPPGSETVVLEVGPGGSVANLLRRGDDPQIYELWVADGSQAAPRPAMIALARARTEPPSLQWAKGWTLVGAELLPVPAAAAAAAEPAESASPLPDGASAARLSDFPGIAPARPAAASAPGDGGGTSAWWLGLGVAAGGLVVWWRRRRAGPPHTTGGRRR